MLSTQYRLRLEGICKSIASGQEVSLDELQRFVDAMDKIRREIYTIPNIVKNAPHTQSEVCGEWIHAYTREEAVFPNSPKHKFWPAVARIDNVYGDRNLVCSCNNILEDENL